MSAKPSINIIGAGKLGKTLARLIVLHGVGKIQGICNKTLASAQSAAKFIEEGRAFAAISDLPYSDITFITTPDKAIKASSVEINYLVSSSIVVHCSGVLSADILRKQDCLCCSIHPMRSFVDPEKNIAQLKGAYCAIEGDPIACQIIEKLFQKLGAVTYAIESSKKNYYHLAGVFASNYLITLADLATRMLSAAGVTNNQIPIITQLMQSTIENLATACTTQSALTGPIARGDYETITTHIKTLRGTDLLSLYKELGKTTLDFSSKSNDEKNILLELLD